MLDATPTSATAVVATIYIRASADTIWRALTDPALTPRYHGGVFETDWAPGSPLRFLEQGELSVAGEVLVFEPPRRLAHSFLAHWSDATRADPVSRVTWEIEPAGDGVCRVTLLHEQLVEGSATARIVATGVPKILSGLKTLLETGSDLGIL